MIVWSKKRAAVGPAGLALVRRLTAAARPGHALALGISPCAEPSDAARQLAESCAREAALRVLLVHVHDNHGLVEQREAIQPAAGWNELIRTAAGPADTIQPTDVPQLSVMLAGQAAADSASRESLITALDALRARYDVILFDLAGEEFIGSNRELARLLDGVLLVLPGPRPSREIARRAKRRLERAGAKVLGVVLDERGARATDIIGENGSAELRTAARAASVMSLLGGRGELWAPSLGGPLSAADFRRVLAVERIRADRTNVAFALLLWSEAPGKNDDADWFETVRNRLRATDVLGRWDARQIAILLPDTDEAGACKLADEVQGLLLQRGIRGAFDAYVHAPRKGRDENEDKYPPNLNGDPARHTAKGNGHADNSQANGHAALPTNDATAAARMAAVPLETLLVRKLPVWKRLLDLASAGAGLIVLAPLFVIVALAVKLTSRGPVLFGQWRSGLGGRPFKMFKFRTMLLDAEARQAELRHASEQDGPAFKLKRDPRVTWVGKLLRKSSIDELPQLWNVLKGEMTLVGPRPLPCDETDACRPWQRRRLEVTPGLTCFWQVEGRSQVSFDDWMRADLRYVRRRSLWTDLRLILRTVPAVLFGRGAH